MPLGGLISLAILLPNILYLVLPPRETPGEAARANGLYRLAQGIEWIGRAGVLVIPFFYPLPALREASVDALAVMVLALGVYYSAWMRYAAKGHRFVLLYAPFLGIPLPMVIAPVVYFAAAAVFFSSWLLAAATVIFAAGHLVSSYQEWQRAKAFVGGDAYMPRRT